MNTTSATEPNIAMVLIARPARLIWLLLRQALWRMPILIIISLVVFVILRGIPVDPLNMLVPPNASPADIARLSHQLGLDRPVLVQYGYWLLAALHGDFGISIQTGTAVTPMILEALPTTLQLLGAGFAAGLVMGLGSGLLSFHLRGTRFEPAIMTLNGIMIAIPDYLWAIVLIISLGVGLQWLPFVGPIDAALQVRKLTGFTLLDSLLSGNAAAFASVVSHLALPALALGLCVATPIARMLHASLAEVYHEDYIHAARLRGVAEKPLLLRHALRNAALPTIALIGVQASVIIGGTLLIETIFGLPGIGALMLRALGAFDMQTIQALAVVYAITVQIVNLVISWALQRINPRLRSSS